MTYKSILAVLTGTGTDPATMSMVDQIAGKFDAHVDVFHVRSDPMSYVSYTGDAMSIDVYSRIIEAAEEENAARAESARKAFDAWMEQKNIPMLDTPDGLDHVTASWREQTGNEADLVAGAGRVYDLVILGPGSDETGAAHDTAIEKAIFDTGRPVLLGPRNRSTASANGLSSCGMAAPKPRARWMRRSPCCRGRIRFTF